ncbi:DEAD/DEAH box helicase [Haploplasma axanthum]|uniref:DEAD-box ATP-dependent RNA helicase n=1 Tax=Haploplasma axanthum TaxID=29552 RepID=A0A449BDC6_HAPAX|nr:DEAD/DEAH box helicase [Haploplasma axanthum]VEU80446.1 DEAD-box ATP-dependent RNA helicase [Haploplasma axanthum]
MNRFNDFMISNEIKEALDLLGYKMPTDIQNKVIPEILKGNNLVVKSRTGSGKTASFAIPLIEKIVWENRYPQVLVLSPTRELAMQIKEEMFNIGRLKRIKIIPIYGKTAFEGQEKQLRQRQHVVVGTPGRVLDHLESRTINLSDVEYLVIDEADEMLRMGFIEQIDDIFKHLKVKQVILLSATLDKKILDTINKYIKDPVYIEEEVSSNIIKEKQKYLKVNKNKTSELFNFINREQVKSAIIFCNTKDKVEEVYEFLSNERMLIKRLHGDLDQRVRTKAITDFKEGKIRYLVATDVAARGIDVSEIEYVINYQIPKDLKTYIHRVGRTGRMGKKGLTLAILSEEEISSFEKKMNEIDYEIEEFVTTKKEQQEYILNKPIEKSKRDEALNKDIMKIHINAGKKTKMRASDIVGTLCSIEGVNVDDIGVITILDISTFVEIMNGKGEHVYNVLQDKTIKGRLRIVSKAE